MNVAELNKQHPVEVKSIGPGLTLASFAGKGVKIVGTKADLEKSKPRFFVVLEGGKEALATKVIHEWCKVQLDWLKASKLEPTIEGKVVLNEKRGYTLA